MLYDRFGVLARSARVNYTSADIAEADALLHRAGEVVAELQLSLDMSQGELSQNLASIYAYVRERLAAARGGDVAALDEAVGHMAELRGAFAAIAEAPHPDVRAARPAVGVNLAG